MEEVILVNEQDEATGAMEKIEAHRQAVLHRAFSVFIFNEEQELLLQRRAMHKYHSGGLWTNTCCGHPRPGEETKAAAARRLQEEMGFDTPLEKAFTFIYRVSFENGLSEHEFDHVFIGQHNTCLTPNLDEVSEYAFRSLDVIGEMLHEKPSLFTAWFRIAFPKLVEWKTAFTNKR